MTRVVDRKATKAARERQRAGIERLRAAFEFTTLHERLYLTKRLERMVWRARPGVPPTRDARAKARKRKRTIVRASRRRNRVHA